MLKELIALDVSEDDVQRGEKKVRVELIKGGEVEVNVTAMPWRQSIQFLQMSVEDPAAGAVYALQYCLPNNQGTDDFLNAILPRDLVRVSNVAMLLSSGVSDAKKRMAAAAKASQNPAESSGSSTALPPSTS